MTATETVVVTGAGRGVGLALVRCFLDTGRRVLATYRTAEGLASLQAIGAGERLLPLELDVANERSVDAFCEAVTTETIDVLVNNAGVYGGRGGLTQLDYADWRATLDVNTIAPLRLSATLLPNLKRAVRPRIVTLSSQMGSLHRKNSGGAYAYRSSKAAVNMAMRTLASDLTSEGVIVCVVHPGWVRTDMGGAGADLSPEESAGGIVELVDGLTMADSGRFFNWNGTEHPW